jgi:hypothetical protein
MAWLVLITQQTQAAKKVLRPVLPRPRGVYCPVPETHVRLLPTASLHARAVLLPAQFPCRDLPCRAILIRIADLGPKRARLVLLAFGSIKIGQIELSH